MAYVITKESELHHSAQIISIGLRTWVSPVYQAPYAVMKLRFFRSHKHSQQLSPIYQQWHTYYMYSTCSLCIRITCTAHAACAYVLRVQHMQPVHTYYMYSTCSLCIRITCTAHAACAYVLRVQHMQPVHTYYMYSTCILCMKQLTSQIHQSSASILTQFHQLCGTCVVL